MSMAPEIIQLSPPSHFQPLMVGLNGFLARVTVAADIFRMEFYNSSGFPKYFNRFYHHPIRA